MAITSGSAWLAGSGISSYNKDRGSLPVISSTTYVPQATTSTVVSAPIPPVVAGVEPQAYEAILYGKDIPLFVGGKMLIGGRICEGPFFGGTQADPTVSFIAYHAQNLVGELFSDTVITSARLRGQEVWNAVSGYIATDKLPSGSFAWNPGHVQNVAFSQSVGRYGTNAVPYTHGITSSWENIPLKPFGGIVPFPSVMVENLSYGDPDDGITRTQAISNILGRMGLDPSEFEVDVSGSDPAWMVASNMSLPDFLRQLRAIFTRYHITYSDKLRIIEPDSFAVDGEITNSNVQRDTLKFKRTDPMTLTRQKRYTFIDVDRDYEMNTALAKEDRYPIPTTDATAEVSIELPIATTSAQAVADIHNSLYEELKARSQMEGVLDRTLFGLECGDGVRFADSSVINMTARVMETVHDFENMAVQFQAVEVINCGVAPNYFSYVVLQPDFELADGSTSITDISPQLQGTAAANGNAHIQNNEMVFDGSGDMIQWPDSDDWDLSDANRDQFTMELFATPTTSAPTNRAMLWHGGVAGQLSFAFWITSSQIQFLGSTTGASHDWSATSSALTWVSGTEYHIAVDKDATGKARIYRDGVMVASSTPSDSRLHNPAAVIIIGGDAAIRYWLGSMRGVRISKGIALYASDAGFTPPTSFPGF